MANIDYTKNAIYEVLTEPNIVGYYGEEMAAVKRKWCLCNATLNEKTDEPLPAWVIDVLRLKEISYKSRIKILMRHGEKIEREIRIKLNGGRDIPERDDSDILKEQTKHDKD